jgi:hypothetical protein
VENFIEMPTQHEIIGISPETTINLCAGIPWDNGYKNIRLFNSVSELDTFLLSKTVKTEVNASPVKIGQLTVRLPYNEIEPLNCNYLYFSNKPLERKNHYAFITGVTPLSVNSCLITFELDVWQENFSKIEINPCYIVRSHIPKSADIIGNYTFPESLEVGQYVYNLPDSSEFTVSVDGTYPDPATSFRVSEGLFPPVRNGYSPTDKESNFYFLMYWNTKEDDKTKQIINGIYYGCNYDRYVTSTDIQTKINNMTAEEASNIIAIGLAPYIFLGTEKCTVSLKKYSDFIGTYKPKNNKCFCYPYNFIGLNNGQTTLESLKLEYFNGDNAPFEIFMPPDTIPTMLVTPRNYCNLAENRQYQISFNDFPKLGVPIDSLKAYIANNSIAIGAQAATTAFHAYSGDIVGAGKGALNVITGLQKADTASDSSFTSAGGYTSFWAKNMGIRLVRIHCAEEYIQKIDNIFTVYGYRIEELGKPNIKSRASWNYLQAKDVTFKGITEPQAREKLTSIIENGVFFWHTNDVGNFSLENN